jgi:hypothetical protein
MLRSDHPVVAERVKQPGNAFAVKHHEFGRIFLNFQKARLEWKRVVLQPRMNANKRECSTISYLRPFAVKYQENV